MGQCHCLASGVLSRRKQSPVLALIPVTSISPHMPLVPFKLLPLCWSPEVVSLCKSKSVWGPLKGDSWESHSFFHHSNLHRFLQTELMRTYLPSECWIPGLCCLVWSLDPLHPRYPCWFLYTHTWVWDRLFCISAPPTHLHECGFFNSLVVGLPYSLIFWRPEWFSCNFCCGCKRV